MKIAFIIIFSLLLLFIITGFILALIIHQKIYKNRWMPDGIIKYYTAEEFGLDSQEFSFKVDKDLLKGAFYSYKNITYKKKLIIYAHGMWSSTRSYMQDIEYFCKKGYKVMTFDYTGTDLSEGKNTRGLAQSLKCLDKAITYLNTLEEYKELPKVVIGHSWGGFAASNIGKYHSYVESIIAISPFTSITDVLKGMLPKTIWFIIPFFQFIDFYICGKYSFQNTKKSLKKYKNKVLILHSLDDTMVKYDYSIKRLKAKNKNANIEFLIQPDKRHNPQYSKEAIKALTEFEEKLRTLPQEGRLEYRKNVDYHKLGALDPNIMNQIIEFIERA